MFAITTNQVDHFRADRMRKFEVEMAEHLRQFSPALCEALDDETLLAAVKEGIAGARERGFTQRGPTRLFLESTRVFGRHFASDPQYPWAREILEDDTRIPMHRAERLFEKSADYRLEVSGEDGEHARSALQAIPEFAQRPVRFGADRIATEMLAAMHALYPQKAAYVGDENLTRLIQGGIGFAEDNGVTEMQGQVLLITLMFALGHGCTSDPFLPWIGRTLTDEKIGDPNARAKRLQRKTLTWLDRILADIDREA